MSNSEDIIMRDISATGIDTTTAYISFDSSPDHPESESSLRSPRTPTWRPDPDSPTSGVSPFDYTKFFSGPRCRNSLPPPPDAPLPWVWQCHLCRHRYPIGVTRRCLYDGHFYCSGETDRPNLKKKRKGQACSSEFDYEGWAEYGDWKRSVLAVVKSPRTNALRACEKCDFPSECRTPESQKPVRRKKVVASTLASLPDLHKEVKVPTSSLFDVPMATDAVMDDSSSIDIGEAVKADITKFRQSKVQELVKIMHEGSRRGNKSGSEKRAPRSSKPVTGLGMIAEEEGTAKKGVAADLSSFLMPVVDIWNGKSSKS